MILRVFPYVCSRGRGRQGLRGSWQHTVFDQPASAKGDLPPLCCNFDDCRSTDRATQRSGIPLDSPAGNRDAFAVYRFLFHGDCIGPRLLNLKRQILPAPLPLMRQGWSHI